MTTEVVLNNVPPGELRTITHIRFFCVGPREWHVQCFAGDELINEVVTSEPLQLGGILTIELAGVQAPAAA